MGVKVAIVVAGAMLLGLAACSDDDVEEQRRELLTPKPAPAVSDERLEQLEIFDAKGNLLPSDQVVGGLRLPRGLAPQQHFAREWYYRSARAPIEVLERYFAERLIILKLERNPEMVVIRSAQLKDDPKAPTVTIRITGTPGSVHGAELYVQQASPAMPRPSREQAEAQLRALREHQM